MAQERAVLAGGCFWGMQDLFRKLPGVESTRVGYTGGDLAHANYRNHGTHAEGIEILLDPERISYRRLLEFFFQIHDPTTPNRQGNDRGSSYRLAGGENVVGDRPARYPTVTLEEIAAAEPAIVILPDEPYSFTARDRADLGPLAGLPSHLVDGKALSWYGPRIADGLATFAALLRAVR
jgi:peptide-methionine (S)-S-oxide reductase